MLHLYAVVEAPPPSPPEQRGHGDGDLRFFEAEGLACAVSSAATPHLAPVADAVQLHQDVLAALHSCGAVLPLRFGTVVEDEAVCRQFLARHQPALRNRLDGLRGCAEYAITVCGLAMPTSPLLARRAEGPGSAYLQALALKQAGWPEADEAFPHDRLLTHARERLLWPRSTAQRGLRASFLVPLEQVSPFLAAVDALQQMRPDLTIAWTGPWPAYSFADIDTGRPSP